MKALTHLGPLALLCLLSHSACTPWYEAYGIRDARQLDDPASLPALGRALVSDSCADKANASVHVRAMGAKGFPAIAQLAQALSSDCSHRTLYPVAQVLGAMGPAAWPHISKLAQAATREQRYLAMASLGTYPATRESLALLQQKMRSKQTVDEWCAQEALNSITKIGPPAESLQNDILVLLVEDYYQMTAMDALLGIGRPTPQVIAGVKMAIEHMEYDDMGRDYMQDGYKKLYKLFLIQSAK